MKRILIIGSGGAGKSTLSRCLQKLLGIPLVHLDSIFWKPGWVETPRPEWKRIVCELVQGDSWIMDGNYSGTLDIRIDACDTIIFLDLPRTTCSWRVIKRLITSYNATRVDMAPGCEEKLNLDFLRWVWQYPRKARPGILSHLQQNAVGKKIIHLRTVRDTEEFLSNLTEEINSHDSSYPAQQH
jgi:adenylate kinase family enzyme